MNEAARLSARRPGTSRGAGTAERIIDAAERLFGELGIEAVSMRQVMLEAGASNKSAVAYHFGDRESLVRAIWSRRLPEIEAVRAAMLERFTREGRLRDPLAIIELLFMPSYLPTDADGRHRYAAFLRNALRWGPGAMLRQEDMRLTPSSAQAIALCRAIHRHLPESLFEWRMQAMTSLFFGLAHDRDTRAANGQLVMPEADFLHEAIAMAAACMAVPVTAGTDPGKPEFTYASLAQT